MLGYLACFLTVVAFEVYATSLIHQLLDRLLAHNDAQRV